MEHGQSRPTPTTSTGMSGAAVNPLIGMVIVAGLSSTTSWTLDEVIQGKSLFPSLHAVQTATGEHFQFPINKDWQSRARMRGVLPDLEVSFGTDVDNDVRVSSGHSSSHFEGREYGFKLRARWHLSSLVFDSWELRAYRQELSARTNRRLRLDEVTQLYFKRVELMFLPVTMHRKLRAARLEGRISILTGGVYFGGSNEQH